MKETIADPAQRAALVARLQRLAPGSPRQWGRMTPHQAICHLSDSFRNMMGPTPISSVATPFSRTFVRWIALHTPLPWPPGVKTRPEVDQEIGGTKPVEFFAIGASWKRSSSSSPRAAATISSRTRCSAG